ncbi:MAG: glycosyl hydrolase family 10, partial [Phototrophicales bacterium]
ELDVTDRYLPGDVNMRDRLVAEAYREFLAVALAQPAVVGVTTWGLSDRYTWLSWHAPRQDKLAVRPLPYSDRLEPKPAYLAIAAAFKNAPKR